MEDRKILLVHGSDRNTNLVSEGVDNCRQDLLLSASVRVAPEHDRQENCVSLPHLEEGEASQPHSLTTAVRAFLARYLSPTVLEVFPEWQGILIESPVLEEAVWVVRDHQHGQRLAQETGKPFIHLDEIMAQEGLTTQKTQEALFSQRHTGGGNEAKSMIHKSNEV